MHARSRVSPCHVTQSDCPVESFIVSLGCCCDQDFACNDDPQCVVIVFRMRREKAIAFGTVIKSHKCLEFDGVAAAIDSTPCESQHSS